MSGAVSAIVGRWQGSIVRDFLSGRQSEDCVWGGEAGPVEGSPGGDAGSGPGHGGYNASNTDMSVGGQQVMFPSDQELSNSQKAEMLIKFFKMEIDEGTWEEKTKKLFTNLLDHLLGVEDEDPEDEDVGSPELK